MSHQQGPLHRLTIARAGLIVIVAAAILTLLLVSLISADVVDFRATVVNGPVRVEWRTDNEVEVDFYGLFRSTALYGPFDQPIREEPSCNVAFGCNYVYTDTNVTPGLTYYYRLETYYIRYYQTEVSPVISVTVPLQIPPTSTPNPNSPTPTRTPSPTRTPTPTQVRPSSTPTPSPTPSVRPTGTRTSLTGTVTARTTSVTPAGGQLPGGAPSPIPATPTRTRTPWPSPSPAPTVRTPLAGTPGVGAGAPLLQVPDPGTPLPTTGPVSARSQIPATQTVLLLAGVIGGAGALLSLAALFLWIQSPKI